MLSSMTNSFALVIRLVYSTSCPIHSIRKSVETQAVGGECKKLRGNIIM